LGRSKQLELDKRNNTTSSVQRLFDFHHSSTSNVIALLKLRIDFASWFERVETPHWRKLRQSPKRGQSARLGARALNYPHHLHPKQQNRKLPDLEAVYCVRGAPTSVRHVEPATKLHPQVSSDAQRSLKMKLG
jgi:hypothetical protein